jgi:hypothetical protein
MFRSKPDWRHNRVGHLLSVEVKLFCVRFEISFNEKLTFKIFVFGRFGAGLRAHRKIASRTSRRLCCHRIVTSETDRMRRVERTERQRMFDQNGFSGLDVARGHHVPF